ncbi:MAG: histidine kinase [Brumimicrobium sp.]
MSYKNNSQLLYWIIQIVSWGAFCIIIGFAVALRDEFEPDTVVQLFILYFLLILSTHTIRFFLLKFNWLNLSIIEVLPRAIVLITVIATSQVLFTNFVINHYIFNEELVSVPELMVNIIVNGIFFFLWMAVYFTYHLFRKSRDQEIYTLKLKALQTETKLKNLKDQLNPHFIFNSLNNIRALIEIDLAKAKSTITTLSSLLRASLQSTKNTFIPLSEELILVEKYLQLEKVRFEERLNFTITNNIDKDVFVPPFVIQTFVENAIKHGVSQSSLNGEVNIIVQYENENLKIEVQNTGEFNPLSTTTDNGIGIENVIRRLQIVYGDEASFSIKNIPNNKVSAVILIHKSKLNQTNYESSYN